MFFVSKECEGLSLEPYAYLRYIFTELPKADTGHGGLTLLLN